MEQNYDETFLARWINNELSQEELDKFEQSPDFLLYQKIAEKSSLLETPNFEKAKVFGAIQGTIQSQEKPKGKVRTLFPKWMYAAAASVVILLGVFYFFNLKTNYETNFGEQLAIMLPDDSEVILNSKSKISFAKRNWENNRQVTLDGEAFFKVQKGSSFTVKTPQGTVTVLGTQFNVATYKDFIEVRCFEGKVSVATTKAEKILTQGNAFRQIKATPVESWTFTNTTPGWRKGESSFTSIPLKYVIAALEKQYQIQIIAKDIDVDQKFSGSFTHKNLQIALQTVFVPMKIGVTFTDEKTVSLVKQ